MRRIGSGARIQRREHPGEFSRRRRSRLLRRGRLGYSAAGFGRDEKMGERPWLRLRDGRPRRFGERRGWSYFLQPLQKVAKVELPLGHQVALTILLSAIENQCPPLRRKPLQVVLYQLTLGTVRLGQKMEQYRAVEGRVASEVTLSLAVVNQNQKFEFAEHWRIPMVADFAGRLVLP